MLSVYLPVSRQVSFHKAVFLHSCIRNDHSLFSCLTNASLALFSYTGTVSQTSHTEDPHAARGERESKVESNQTCRYRKDLSTTKNIWVKYLTRPLHLYFEPF